MTKEEKIIINFFKNNFGLIFSYLFIVIFFTACENGDYVKGEKYMKSEDWDSAVESFNKVPSDDKKYNESLMLMNESIWKGSFSKAVNSNNNGNYFQAIVFLNEIPNNSITDTLFPKISELKNKLEKDGIDKNKKNRKKMLSNNYDWSQADLQKWKSLSTPLLIEKLSNIMIKKKQNGDYFYSSYPMLVFNDDVMVWTTYYSDGSPQKNVREGARTTLIFKQNGGGEIVMQHGASEKRANLEWTIFWSLGNNSNKDNYINFKITGVETRGTYTSQTYPSNFSDNFRNNRGEVKVNRLINDSKIIQKDRKEFYNFAEKVKADFIKKYSPTSLSEWKSYQDLQ